MSRLYLGLIIVLSIVLTGDARCRVSVLDNRSDGRRKMLRLYIVQPSFWRETQVGVSTVVLVEREALPQALRAGIPCRQAPLSSGEGSGVRRSVRLPLSTGEGVGG
jgi:hypothetical protein